MFRILALDGGGIKGVFTASVLAEFERQSRRSLVDHFDLICGTSTGGILAIGIGLGLTAEELVNFYRERGPRIFPATGFRDRTQAIFRQLFLGPKYSSDVLRTELEVILGTKKFGESRRRLVIPSYDAVSGRIYSFKTAHEGRFTNDVDLTAAKVALATSAATTYFPAATAHDHSRFVDGGVWANCPAMVGLVEAVSFLKVPLGEIKMLSVGTTTEPFSIINKINASVLRWNLGLLNLMFEAQMESALAQARILLGDALHRVNFSSTAGRFSLDNASNRAIDDLTNIGVSEARKKENLSIVIGEFLNGTPAPEFQPSRKE